MKVVNTEFLVMKFQFKGPVKFSQSGDFGKM